MGDLWVTYGIDREIVGRMMRHFRDILRYFEGGGERKICFVCIIGGLGVPLPPS